MISARPCFFLPVLGLMATGPLADEPARPRPGVDFARDVYPVLRFLGMSRP